MQKNEVKEESGAVMKRMARLRKRIASKYTLINDAFRM